MSWFLYIASGTERPVMLKNRYTIRMNIWIDGRSATATQKTGKGQWTLRLIEHLLPRVSLTVCIGNGEVPTQWKAYEHSIRRFPSGTMWHWHVAKALRSSGAIYISPTSFIVPFIVGESTACVPVIHDLIAFRSDPHEWKAKLIERCTLPRVLRCARHILVLSTSTRSDLLARFSREIGTTPITTVYSGPQEDTPLPSDDDSHTILCPATLCPRKNQLRLIRAYGALPNHIRQRYRLLLIGARGWHDDEILHAIETTSGVEWKGYVPDREYAKILHTASILAYPSLYEGFGLPVLDAMQRGIPVLTSLRGSLHEVAGDSAELVDPLSTEDMTRGLLQLITDRELRSQLQASGPRQASQFTWEKTTEHVVRAVRSMETTEA
jgi:alpha-1,3-rhamnosyl/mannosyltransferase